MMAYRKQIPIIKKGGMIMKTRSSNTLLLLFLVPLLFLTCGIPCIVQAYELKVPASYTFNWDPAPPDLTPSCAGLGGGTTRRYDFKHIFKVPKFDPDLGALTRVYVRFHSSLFTQQHSSTKLGSQYRIEGLVNVLTFFYGGGDSTPGAYFRFSTPHHYRFHPIPIQDIWVVGGGYEGLYGTGDMGFALEYPDNTYRNDSVTRHPYALDVSDHYSYSDPTSLDDFIGSGTFDIEFGSHAYWHGYVMYNEYTGWCKVVECYDEILVSDCPTELTTSASLQWTVVADVTYIYDPLFVSMHGPASARANGPYFGVVGTPIWFDASGSIGYPFGVVLYEWHWGDDTVTTTMDNLVQHVYSQPYQGQVELIITDGEGATASDWASVTVTSPWIPGDLDHDGDVDLTDISIIQSYLNKPATACPSCDLDGDGMITALDARKAVLLCTRPRCATQ
jgi:hypothetical protein